MKIIMIFSLFISLQTLAFSQNIQPQIEQLVRSFGWVNVAPEDKWRDVNGFQTARLLEGKIQLTYQITGCPNPRTFLSSTFPRCQRFHREIEKAFELIQQRSSKLHFQRVEADANIQIRFERLAGNGYAQVFHFDSHRQQVSDPAYPQGERFDVGPDPSRRAASSNMIVNLRRCFWIDDPSICQTSNAIKPMDTPSFKVLMLHEIMHTLGFQHTQGHRDLSIVGGWGGHGHFEINDFDLAMIESYYSRIIDSYLILE